MNKSTICWCVFASFVLVNGTLYAQRPFLVRDIVPGTGSAAPQNLVDLGGVLFFAANDGVNGNELWKSDGTTAGTVMVKDILPGAGSSNPIELTNVDGTLFFAADDGVSGQELWKSDGTDAGTVLVKDLTGDSLSTSMSDLTALGDKLFFIPTVATLGPEPWISDGTDAGTLLLQDICPGSCSSASGYPLTVGNLLYFATQGALYVTDGTPAGTVPLPGLSGSANPRQLTLMNGEILFAADGGGLVGSELFKSDGTTVVLVKDIRPGGQGSSPSELVNAAGTLYFRATDGVAGSELWKSDGTETGTVMVRDIRPGSIGSSLTNFAVVKDIVFFSGNDGSTGTELWQSDGTAGGTFVRDVQAGVSSSNPSELFAVNDTLFLKASKAFYFGAELMKTSPMTPNLELVADLDRTAGSGDPLELTRSGPFVFFTAIDTSGGSGQYGRELWALRVDGLDLFTVTSTDGQNELEWVNPIEGNLQIRYRNDAFPVDETDGTQLLVAAGRGDGRESFVHSVSNGTPLYYRAFVDDGVDVVSLRSSLGVAFDTSGSVKWRYATGASSMEPPGIGSVLALSNDRILHSMTPGIGGGRWPPGYRPFVAPDVAQGRPPVVPVSLRGATKVTFFGTQGGEVYAVDAATGAYLWRSPDLGFVQAVPAGMFTTFGGAHDLLLVGTRRSSLPNAFYALFLGSGSVAWAFDNGADAMGIVSSQASVDYATNRVYFTSFTYAGGSDRTVWCLEFTSSGANLIWARGQGDPVPVGAVTASPTLRGAAVYVGTNDSRLHALHAGNGTNLWTGPFPLNDGTVKGFVWAPRGRTELYLSTDGTVWALGDLGGTVSELWRETRIPLPSIPLLVRDYLYVGGNDGALYEIHAPTGPSSLKSIVIESGVKVGAPSFDLANELLYVGTDSGAIFGVSVPLP